MMSKAFEPVIPINQLFTRILIWGTFGVLFCKFVLNAGWIFTIGYLLLVIIVETYKYYKAKKLRANREYQ